MAAGPDTDPSATRNVHGSAGARFTIRPMITFTHIAEPIGKGSTTSRICTRKADGRQFVATRDSTGSRGERHERGIAVCADVAMQTAGEQLVRAQAIIVHVRFYMPRPKGHYGTGRNAGLLKDHAPLQPIVKPDADKLMRRVLDALTGVVYADDGQVVEAHATKHYADDGPPRTEVDVSVVDQQTVGQVVAVDQLALVA